MQRSAITELCFVSISQQYQYLILLLEARKKRQRKEAEKDKQRNQERDQTSVRGLDKYLSHGGDWILTRQALSILHCTVTLSSIFPPSSFSYLPYRYIFYNHLSIIKPPQAINLPLRIQGLFFTDLPYQKTCSVLMHLVSIYELTEGEVNKLGLKKPQLLSLKAFNRHYRHAHKHLLHLLART